MREIVIDVETTGLWVNSGHKVIEIACIELERYQPTGRVYHRYINPLLSRMPIEAFGIHGIPIEFLWRHAPFKNIADSFLEFIGDAQLVIHNAAFDSGFINSELRAIGYPPLSSPLLDTLSIARSQFPGAANNLDALCRRFKIDNSHRSQHGAMIDCALLATVYFELIGGKQPLFAIPNTKKPAPDIIEPPQRTVMAPRKHHPLSAAEIVNFEIALKQIKNPIWIFNPNQPPQRPPLEIDDEIHF